jgi:glycolate oxidase
MPISAGTVARLRSVVGAEFVLDEPIERHLYAKDAGLRRHPVSLVVLPAGAAEVAEVMRIAADEELDVVPRGGGSGLTGGAVPTGDALVVAVTRMNEIHEVDTGNRTAWVGPGVINLDLSTHTEPLGLHFAPDPSSQSVCTIGGNVANNAGGPHCLAEGSTHAHILGVELVLPDGEVVVLGGPAPDLPGLDLRGVVVGSEGTLGIVTKVLVRLTPNPPDVRTLLISFDRMADAMATVSGIIAEGVVPAALEMMDRNTLRVVEGFLRAGLPQVEGALLAEVTGTTEAVDAEAQVVRRVAGANGATEVRLAADDEERAMLWLGRKAAFGAVAQLAPDFYLHDTVVPRTRLVEVMERVAEIGERHGITLMNVFHAGDGNLHPIMGFDLSEPGTQERVQEAGREIVEACVDAGGALSGEHGIGTEKRAFMTRVFAEADLDAQARVREAFDPDGRMNPDKVLPEGARCADLGRPLPEGAWV